MKETNGEHPAHALSRARRRLLVSALLLILCWLALLAWQLVDHARESRRHRDSFEHAGAASLGVLESAVRSMGPGRRRRPEFLEVVFDEVSEAPGIRGAWLTEPDGTLLYERSERPYAPNPRDFPGALWLEDGLVVGRQVDIGACPFDSRGRPRGPEALSLPLHAFLFIDSGELHRELAADLRLRLGIQAAAFVALVAALLVVRARSRTGRLRTELAVAEERARRHKEWALLGAGLAHETKNPLSVVRGIAQGLVSEPADSEEATRARQIVDEVDRVVARINEFLHYSRPVEPQPEPVELHSLLEEMAALVTPDLEPRRGQLVVEPTDAVVRADRGLLRQILLNLLVNSAHAITAGGSIHLRLRSATDDRVSLEVEDDGRGMPLEHVERVFEPYYTRSEKGTGLGLAIVRRLAEAHDWQVELESEPEVGTVVRILGMKRVCP